MLSQFAKNPWKMSLKRSLFSYFLLVSMLMVWVMVNFAKWCPQSSKSSEQQVFPHAGSHLDHDFRMRDKELRERAERLQAQELHLKQVETQLILNFPQHSDLIFGNEENVACIYAITPTYARPEQKAELTRLSHTFLHVRNFHWIVVEDSGNRTKLVTELLKRSGLKYTQLNVQTPTNYKLEKDDPRWSKPRGVLQRNKALDWIRNNVDPQQAGVVYFADDDNTYDLRLFDEMRSTQRVAVWPVGLVGGLMFERPICDGEQVVGFYTYYAPKRPYPMDMAGFAINVRLILERPEAAFKLRVKYGYLESEFLSALVTRQELEPRAGGCTKVLVWHTRTEKTSLKNEEKLKQKGKPGSDPRIEV